MHPNKRSRKRARQAEEAEQAHHQFRYASLASAALKTLSLDSVGLSIVDVEISPDLSGNPDGMLGWLIFASRSEAKRAGASNTAATIT